MRPLPTTWATALAITLAAGTLLPGSAAAPTALQTATATVTVDPSMATADLPTAMLGVDDTGGLGTFDQTNQEMLPAPAALLQPTSLGVVRLEENMNIQGSCAPTSSNSCNTWRWKDHTPGADTMSATSTWGPNLDAYMREVAQLGSVTTTMINVNIEGGNLQDAIDEVAYMNGSTSSLNPLIAPWAKLRAHNGHPAPYGVKYWEIGNEEYGLTRSKTLDPGTCTVPTTGPSSSWDQGSYYGCLVKRFGDAMRAIDSSIVIATSMAGGDFTTGVLSAAAGHFTLVDYHAYLPPSDSYATTFTGDGQTAIYGLPEFSVASGTQQVTYAIYVTGQDDPSKSGRAHIDALLDGIPLTLMQAGPGTDTAFNGIRYGAYSQSPEILVAHATQTPGAHNLSVVACSSASIGLDGHCLTHAAKNSSLQLHPLVVVKHITVGPNSDSATALQGGLGCFRPLADPLVDTRVATTQGRNGTGPSDPGTPWRVSAADFATTIANDALADGRNAMQATDTWQLRKQLATHPEVSVLIGEYAAYGGCDAAPYTFSQSHQGGLISTMLLLGVLPTAFAGANPVIGAANFALGAYRTNGPVCSGFGFVHSTGCETPGPSAYLTAAGEDLARFFAAAQGQALAAYVGGPTVTLPQIMDMASSTVQAVHVVAFRSGTTIRLAIINTLATTAVTTTVTGLASAPASAMTTTGSPDDANSDAAPSTVTASPLAVTTDGNGGYVLTLPPYSVTTLTIG